MTEEQLTMFNKLTKLQQNVALVKIANPLISNVEAYKRGGGTAKKNANAIAASASEVLNNPNVVAFLSTFETSRINSAVMSRDELLEDLTLIARSSIFDVAAMVYDDDQLMNMTTGEIVSAGNNTITIKKLDEFKEEYRKLIKSIKPSPHGLIIELHDPMVARKMIADIQGMNAAKKLDVTVTKSLDEFYEELNGNT